MIVFDSKGTFYAYLGLAVYEVGAWQYGWAPALMGLGAWLFAMGVMGH